MYRRLPLVGFFIDVFTRNLKVRELSPRYGPVYKSDVLGFPVTIISDLDAIKACYKDSEVFRSGGAFPFSLSTLFGDKALFILDGKEHATKRKPVMPAFSPQLFPLYFSSIQEDARSFWHKVSQQVERDGTSKLQNAFKEHYLGIIIRLTTGGQYASSEASAEAQFLRVRDLLLAVAGGMITFPFGPVWWKALHARDELIDILGGLVRDRLSTRKDTIEALREVDADRIAAKARGELRAGSLDLLTVLVSTTSLPTDAGAELDETTLRELCELVLLLWFAGYSTQASASSCCLMELGFNADIHGRLRDEQDAIVRAHDGDVDMTLEQVNKEMPLLDSYINEILRLYPPAPVLFRKTAKATTVCGHAIAVGTIVGLDAWGGQRNAAYYAEPETLKAERFVAGGEAPGVVSFGGVGGAHFCLGAALARVGMKATVGTMVREFDMRVEERQDREYVSVPEMTPRSGVEVRMCRRREGI